MRYKRYSQRLKPVKYQATEDKQLFSEKEFIIRSNGKMKIIRISTRVQWCLFALLLLFAVWVAYSYRMYSVSDRIISYQEQKLDETRSAYVDLMSDFVGVHKNIASMMEVMGNKPEEEHTDSMDEYLKKAEIIEERIRKITANENWISERELNRKNALKEAIISRDVAIEEKNLLEEKVKHLEDMVRSLQAFELDLLQKVENVSNKEIDKIKGSISLVNGELKKRGKYFNPLANSKKDSRGGVFVPDNLASELDEALLKQAEKSYTAVDDVHYYQEALKRIPLGKPVWTYWLSSPFGKRSDPFNAKSARHKGVDLASNKGNKIKSMAEGRVTRAETVSGYGKMVEIDHGNGFKTKYAHMNAIYVKKGQNIAQGETVGEVGSTGRSTGPHLHYEVLYDGVHLNPMVFIKAK